MVDVLYLKINDVTHNPGLMNKKRPGLAQFFLKGHKAAR